MNDGCAGSGPGAFFVGYRTGVAAQNRRAVAVGVSGMRKSCGQDLTDGDGYLRSEIP